MATWSIKSNGILNCNNYNSNRNSMASVEMSIIIIISSRPTPKSLLQWLLNKKFVHHCRIWFRDGTTN